MRNSLILLIIYIILETLYIRKANAKDGCPFQNSAPLFKKRYNTQSQASDWTFELLTKPRKLANTINWPMYKWTPDGRLSSIYNPTKNIWYHFQPNTKTYRAYGSKPLPQHMQGLSPSTPVMGGRLKYDAYNSGGEWLMAVHPTGKSGHLTGFLHVEDQFRNLGQKGSGPAFKSIALACSSDWGKTWDKKGRILTSGTKPSKKAWSGIGDLDVVWDWQESRWIMIMQNMKGSEGAMLTAAVSYDKSAAPDTWKKWDGSDFTMSGWKDPGEPLDWLEGGANPSIHWNTYLQLWVMVYGGWDGSSYITSAKKLPFFSPSRRLINGSMSNKKWYPTLMSAKKGDREGGRILHLYYRDRHMDKGTSDFMTMKIKLSRK